MPEQVERRSCRVGEGRRPGLVVEPLRAERGDDLGPMSLDHFFRDRDVDVFRERGYVRLETEQPRRAEEHRAPSDGCFPERLEHLQRCALSVTLR